MNSKNLFGLFLFAVISLLVYGSGETALADPPKKLKIAVVDFAELAKKNVRCQRIIKSLEMWKKEDKRRGAMENTRLKDMEEMLKGMNSQSTSYQKRKKYLEELRIRYKKRQERDRNKIASAYKKSNFAMTQILERAGAAYAKKHGYHLLLRQNFPSIGKKNANHPSSRSYTSAGLLLSKLFRSNPGLFLTSLKGQSPLPTSLRFKIGVVDYAQGAKSYGHYQRYKKETDQIQGEINKIEGEMEKNTRRTLKEIKGLNFKSDLYRKKFRAMSVLNNSLSQKIDKLKIKLHSKAEKYGEGLRQSPRLPLYIALQPSSIWADKFGKC